MNSDIKGTNQRDSGRTGFIFGLSSTNSIVVGWCLMLKGRYFRKPNAIILISTIIILYCMQPKEIVTYKGELAGVDPALKEKLKQNYVSFFCTSTSYDRR